MTRTSDRLSFVLTTIAIVLIAPTGARALDMSASSFTLTIGALPPIDIAQSPDPVSVSLGAGNSFQQPAVFAGNVILAKDLFTGVSLISSLNVTLNPPTIIGSFAPGGGQNGGFGGASPLDGRSVLGVLGGVLNLVVPLNVAGTGGTTKAAAFDLKVTVTGAKWTTRVARITGITTTTTTTTINGVVNTNIFNTATVAGADNRTAGGAGTIVLVSPVRVLTNAAGNLPAFAIQTLHFSGPTVPEPGTLLLLGGCAAGLAAAGRKRVQR